jgi:hypothetical protein
MTREPDHSLFVLELVHARRFASITAFADAQPTSSLRRLADDLRASSARSGVSVEEIRRELAVLWREEAERLGTSAIERMARRFLVGELHDALPKGWLASWTDTHDARATAGRLSAGISAWLDDVGERHRSEAIHLRAALFDVETAGTIRTGWLPADADDVLLVSLFAHHWSYGNKAIQNSDVETQDMDPLDE